MEENNFILDVITGIQEKSSQIKLNGDIKRLQKRLNKLQLKAEINPQSIDEIKKKMDSIKVKAQLDPNAIQNLEKQLEGIVSKHTITISNINVNQGELAKAGQQAGKLISDSAEKAISNVSSSSIGKYFKIDSSTSNQFQTEMKKLVSGWTNAKGKLTDIKIDTRTSFDKEAGENIERLHQATVTYKNELDEVIKKTIAWRQIGTTTNAKGQKVALRGFVEVAGQYSKSLDTASAKTDNFVKKQNRMAASLQNTINQITSRAFDQNSSKPITSEASLGKLNTQVAYVENAMHDLRNSTSATFDDAVIKVRNEISELRILESELRKADNVSTKMKGVDITSGLAIARNDLEKFKADAKDFPQITKTIQELDTAIGKVGDASSLNAFNDQLRVARSELSKIKSEANTSNRNEKVGINVSGLQSQIADLQRISPAIDKFKAEINGAEVTVQSLYNDLAKVNTQSDFSVVNSKFKAFRDAAKSAGITVTEVKEKSGSFFASLKKNFSFFSYWLSPMYLMVQAIAKVKQAFAELKEVDTYLTEISKTNHSLTSSDLKQIGDKSFNVASSYGRTATDYLSGVQDMSRAGYQNAEAMAELSTAAQGAGDMTSDVANKMIIATDKAYKMNGAVEELTEVLDGINWVCDNNAVNMSELSEGMSIVASTAASFGVDVNELTAALGTMSATTQQSGSEVARAFKAILLNIRQVSDEEEGIDAEGLTKYEKACNDLGVSLKETKDGVLSLRDPMEVLKELSIEYNKLSESDIKRTNLLSSVGGKLRSTQLDALLRQWSTYENMLQQYAEGSGTMAAEAEKTANSWEGSMNRLSNTWASTINNIANSDAIITIINGTNSLLDVLNKLTSKLGSIGTIGLGAFAFLNKGRSNDFAL